MAIDKDNINNTVAKPQIWLYGVRTTQNTNHLFSERVDHARTPVVGNATTITGVTQLDKDDILTFQDGVRIIITGQMTPKHSYARQTVGLGDLEFEGNLRYHPDKSFVDYYAETYYTFNGKDPIRTKARVYNYLDMYDLNTNPSSANNIDMGGLGFLLKTSPTGSELITLKAKTYFRGQESRIAVAVFKIARKTTGSASLEFDGTSLDK